MTWKRTTKDQQQTNKLWISCRFPSNFAGNLWKKPPPPGPLAALSSLLFSQDLRLCQQPIRHRTRLGRFQVADGSMAGWWFGTFCIFPYIGNNHPNWRSYFSEGLTPPTRWIYHGISRGFPKPNSWMVVFHGPWESCFSDDFTGGTPMEWQTPS